MSIRGRLVREMHLTRTWHLWGVLLASLFLLWAPGRAQESNLDTVFTSTLQAYQEHKLTAQQKDEILDELRQLQEELQESANIARFLQESANIARIAERTFQTNKADLSKNAQAAAAKKVQEIKEHSQLAKEQANHYAQALLQNTLDGKDTDKAKYVTNKNTQAFSTAKEIQQIVNDPNYRSWSSHFFKVAGQTATNIKEQLSPHEIKQLLRKGHSDEHPVIKKSLDTVLGKDAARVLIDGSRDDLKRAL